MKRRGAPAGDGKARRKLVVFEVEPHEAPAFKTLAAEFELELAEEPLTAANAERFRGADIVSTFIYSTLERDVLEKLAGLRLIATRSTGFDHIDLAYCARHGIAVSNVPNYGANTVAEHVFALLLAISHRLPEAIDRARTGHFSPEGLQGFDLAGKTMGVIGTGSIGRHVVRIAKGFGMNVLACDTAPDQALASASGFRYCSLDDLLKQADIVTLHVPATGRQLIGDREFRLMKPGVVVINTARGSLIDARALIQALSAGKVAAAGLDVLPDEPAIREEAELICSFFCNRHDLRNLVADHVLLRMRNVVVTPHSAFNTREAVGRIIETTIENIRGFASGDPRNLVAASSRSRAAVANLPTEVIHKHGKSKDSCRRKRVRRHR